MKHIAVVGAGPAGLTAAWELAKKGYIVEVIEAKAWIGGRTRSVHFEEGHHVDTGAGWLTSFYPQTFKLFEEIGFTPSTTQQNEKEEGREKETEPLTLRPRGIRGASDLYITNRRGGSGPEIHPLPMSRETIEKSTILTTEEKKKLLHYLYALASEQSDNLGIDLARDHVDSQSEFSPLGENVMKYMMAPMFEGPFFAPMRNFSAAMVRSWLKALTNPNSKFYQVANGMDAPWLHLAALKKFKISLNCDVKEISVLFDRFGKELVKVDLEGGDVKIFDAVILCTPAPITYRLIRSVPEYIVPIKHKEFIRSIRYAPQVRVYLSRISDEDADSGIHLCPPIGSVGTIEYFSGRRGAWGNCPANRQWILICATANASRSFLERKATDSEITEELYNGAKEILPSLFPLESADVILVHSWQSAVPIMEPNHYTKLSKYGQRPPVVFGGDWCVHACVEGAVRSGIQAASHFPPLKGPKSAKL